MTIDAIPLPPEWDEFHRQYGTLTVTLDRPSFGVGVTFTAQIAGETATARVESFTDGGWATEEIANARMVQAGGEAIRRAMDPEGDE